MKISFQTTFLLKGLVLLLFTNSDCLSETRKKRLLSGNVATEVCQQLQKFSTTKVIQAPLKRNSKTSDLETWFKWKDCGEEQETSCKPFQIKRSSTSKAAANSHNNEQTTRFSGKQYQKPTDAHHPCYRNCSTDPASAMICAYKFTISHYYALSWECGSCPVNAADCFNKYCIPLDSLRRPLSVINQQLPGPPIDVCQGDTVVVDVENHMTTEGTTIHWHGIHQKGTPWMDGVPLIAQCFIPPGTTFRYEFQVPNGGTYFYHSHSGFQRADGMFGALVVRIPDSKNPHLSLYDFDIPEHELVIGDLPALFGIAFYLEFEFAFSSVSPKSILINGRGFPLGFFAQATNANFKTLPFAPPHELRIQKGKRYRWRMASNGIFNCPIEVSIENHTMVAISADSFDFEAVHVSSIVIFAGDRWDFIVEGNQPVGSYWIKFRGIVDCGSLRTRVFQLAVLNYEGVAPGTIPNHIINTWENSGLSTDGIQLGTLNLAPAGPSGKFVTYAELNNIVDDDPEIITKPKPDHLFYMFFDFNIVDSFHRRRREASEIAFNDSRSVNDDDGDEGAERRGQIVFAPQFNYVTYKSLPSPPTTQPSVINQVKTCGPEYYADEGCRAKFCACASLVKVKLNSIVEMVLIDNGFVFDISHPIHVHGHSFRVVSYERVSRQSLTVAQFKRMDILGEVIRRTSKAPIKDNIAVPDGGYAIIRFRANNPGFWFAHCHFEMHAELGMAFTIQVGEINEMPKPPPHFPKCGSFLPPAPTFVRIVEETG